MSIPYVVDGETELSSELFNPWVDQMNGLQTGDLPIALPGIEGTRRGAERVLMLGFVATYGAWDRW